MPWQPYTPGPWRLDKREGGGYRVTAENEHVAFVESSLANAQLMAAAPRLLAALEPFARLRCTRVGKGPCVDISTDRFIVERPCPQCVAKAALYAAHSTYWMSRQ